MYNALIHTALSKPTFHHLLQHPQHKEVSILPSIDITDGLIIFPDLLDLDHAFVVFNKTKHRINPTKLPNSVKEANRPSVGLSELRGRKIVTMSPSDFVRIPTGKPLLNYLIN